jgi:isoamylase
MFLGGDEFRRTQRGNNNAYCQDSDISWFDWQLLEAHGDIYRFTRGMIALRDQHPALRKEAFYTGDEIAWFDPAGGPPDWSEPENRQLACLIHDPDGPALYLIFNAGTDAVTFALPGAPGGGRWYLAVDTAHPSPEDLFQEDGQQALDDQSTYHAEARSSVILVAHS